MISNSELEVILNDWSFWKKSPDAGVRREVLNKLPKWDNDLVWVIQGVRRSGKSTLLIQWMYAFGLDPQHCFFINFEDPRLSDSSNHLLLNQIVEFAHAQRQVGASSYFFFDEIQNVTGWEKWFHSKLERPTKDYFIVTGSNATLLGGQLGSSLTGRHRTIEMFPFSYSEYLLAKPGRSLELFLTDGGFPRTLLMEDKEAQSLLREYFQDILERDVRRHVATRSSQALQQIAKSVFESTGSETSLRKLAKISELSVDTVHSYIDAFENAYLILSCPYFTYSERKRAVRAKKYYPIDLGLHRSVISRAGLDLGKRLETAVFHQLRRKYSRVFYWRGVGEIDFVVQDGSDITPIQVSWQGAKPRHEKALYEFKQEFPNSRNPIFISRENAENFFTYKQSLF